MARCEASDHSDFEARTRENKIIHLRKTFLNNNFETKKYIFNWDILNKYF